MKKIHEYHTQQTTSTVFMEVPSVSPIVEFLSLSFYKRLWIIDRNLIELISLPQNEIILWIDGGDSSKSEDIFTQLIADFQRCEIDKSSHIIAVGGGSISDLAGYAASVYHRGIPFSIVPSTLLGLIDASMGGKNGINFHGAKNQLGTIYQPQNIFYIPSLIRALPQEEISDGFAEIIKYGLIIDEELYATLSQHTIESVLNDEQVFNHIIQKCIRHKSNIIEQDPFESHLRKILNFGHTVGHAIESLYGYSHGQSVGLGMCIAAQASISSSIDEVHDVSNLKNVLKNYGLPTRLEIFEYQKLFEKIKSDKKKQGDSIHFVFLKKIGEASIEKISLAELNVLLKRAEDEQWIL